MSDALSLNEQSDNQNQASGFAIGAGIGILVLTIILVVAAVLLAANAETTAPAVEVVRDVLIIVMALELAVIGVALVVFLVQLARFVNLMNNEVRPILASATDTVNAVRGTALFMNKHVTAPVMAVVSTLGGFGKIMRDADAIRKAAGIAVTTAVANWPTGSDADKPPAEPTGPAPADSPPGSPDEQRSDDEN